jgi:hypothetical protein
MMIPHWYHDGLTLKNCVLGEDAPRGESNS